MTDRASSPRGKGNRRGGHGLANKVIPAVLRTPLLHRVVSRDLMLISFAGRKTGRRFTTPVTYTPTAIGVAFFSDGRWWANLRGGAPVTLRLRGRDVAGHAVPVEDRAVVAREAAAYLARHGAGRGGRIGLSFPSSGEPTAAEIREAVRNHVVVYVATEGR